MRTIEVLLGETLSDALQETGGAILFSVGGEPKFRLRHLEADIGFLMHGPEITGDLEDLVGSPILGAHEATEYGDTNVTTYTISTVRGSVKILWRDTYRGGQQ